MNSTRILSNSAGAKFLELIATMSGPLIIPDVVDAFTALILKQEGNPFQAYWLSSLGLSAKLGFPDAYSLSPRDAAQTIIDIKTADVDKLLVIDADNAGQSWKNASYAFKLFQTLGLAMGVVENKRGVKYNSVDQNASKYHELETPSVFAQKINAAMSIQNTVLVAVRLEEGIIYDKDEEVAVQRALDAVDFFMANSKPDAFVFHWKKPEPTAVLSFAERYHEKYGSMADKPFLICIPTTYAKNTSNDELYNVGYSVIIYGNIFLRSHLLSVKNTVQQLVKGSPHGLIEDTIATVDDVFSVIGT